MAIAIKEYSDGKMIVEGYGVYFGGQDIVGDTFDRATNFELDFAPHKKLLYSHRKNPAVKSVIGTVIDSRVDDEGVFFRAEFNKAFKYRNAIKKLANLGLLGMSTGSAEQLTTRVGGTIKDWPIVELSLSVTPMEPRTVGASVSEKDLDFEAIKAIEDFEMALVEQVDNTQAESDEPGSESDGSTGSDSGVIGNNVTENKQGVTIIMSTSNAPVDQANPEFMQEVASFMKEYRATKVESETALKSMGDQLSAVLTAIQGSNKMMGAGFVSQDGGRADKHVKSFSDFLMSVRRNDTTRLATVYGATKDLSGETGTTGGFLIPPEFETSLLQVASMNSNVMNRVRTIPAGSDSGRWPALDQYIAPSAGSGQTAYAAGVTAANTTPGSTLAKTEPGFEMLEWRLSKVGGYTEVDNELMQDSPLAVEALLTSLFGIAINAKNERNVLRGTGVGEPTGILNSSAVVNVTPATNNLFTWPDVATMFSRFKSAGGTPIWLIHPSRWPDIMKMEIGTAGANAWTANMSTGNLQTLNGYQILMSEHLPQATNSGSVLLVDLSGYLFWQRNGIQIAFSDHAAFRDDQGTWRFTQRCDGKPWLRAPIILADPQGSYQISPYVNHND
jgi:HK97 family phage major capsid protein